MLNKVFFFLFDGPQYLYECVNWPLEARITKDWTTLMHIPIYKYAPAPERNKSGVWDTDLMSARVNIPT